MWACITIKEIRRRNGPDPKPLRSDRYPDGIPGLPEKGQEGADAANELYKFTADLAFDLTMQGIDWVIENPTNSLFWKTSWMVNLLSKLQEKGIEAKYAHMQMCMHGGDRDKRTTLMYSGKVNLQTVSILCDKNHKHKPWGIKRAPGACFATAEERNYPVLFCKKIARLAATYLLPLRKKPSSLEQEVKKWAGKQPRRAFNDLISEFRIIKKFGEADTAQLEKVQKASAEEVTQCGTIFVNGPAKILNVWNEGASGSRMCGELGEYWTPEEFVDLAKECIHPMDSEVKVPQRIANVIYDIAVNGKQWVLDKRRSTVEHYTKIRRDLSTEEAELHDKLHPELEKVVSRKHILLFRKMLMDVQYDDMGVVDILTQGVKIVGELPNTGIWKKDEEKRPKCSIKHLWASAKDAQAGVLSPRSQYDPVMAKEILKLTQDEVKDGLLKGPIDRDQLKNEVGPLWIAARRFGIKQGPKIRPVDDFSEFGVNQAFGATEKVSMLGVDHVVAWSRAWISAATNEGDFSITDHQDIKWSGRLHHSWSVSEWRSLRGRVADLKNAYKQLAVCPAHSCFSVVGVWDPDSRRVRLYRALALMFGETAAVYAFLRISRALATLGARLFSLVLVEFFDDFTQIECQSLGESAMSTLESMLSLLGWDVAMTEAKRKPFSVVFTSLGVKVDFERAVGEEIIVSNKDGRIEGIRSAVEELQSKGTMNFKEALSVKGKLQFAEGQLFYRVAAPACRLLAKWASDGGERPLDERMRLGLRKAIEAIFWAGPRVVEPRAHKPPVIIFTDGACEEDGTTIGGVLITRSGRPEAFGARLTEEAVKRLASKLGQKQVIGQAELLPVLVAKQTWEKEIGCSKVIFFIDNDSARLALIKGYSPVLSSLELIMQCAIEDAKSRCSSWYARVPTHSNIADDPSRMRKDRLVRDWNAKIVKPVLRLDGWWFSDVL